ncbi:MAG: ComEA family DNA-binding protein [Salinivirgaceae bacterium]
MKRFIKSWFSLSTREIRGASVLIVLILLALMAPYGYNLLIDKPTVNHTEFIETIDKLILVKSKTPVPNKSSSATYFSFDPNTVGFNDLLKLGFSEKQARTLVNYRNAGGKFYKNDDLKKVYGISEAFYMQLKPYVAIASIEINEETKSDNLKVDDKNAFSSDAAKNYSSENLDLKIELNTATSADLIRIPGIGPVYAKRIVSYRDNLGGFYSSSQLAEVYGLSDSLLVKINKFLFVDTSAIKPINLNTIDFRSLNNHPYINYVHTKNIFKYKELMDTIIDSDELLRNHLIDSISYYKLKPYLILK